MAMKCPQCEKGYIHTLVDLKIVAHFTAWSSGEENEGFVEQSEVRFVCGGRGGGGCETEWSTLEEFVAAVKRRWEEVGEQNR